MTKPTTQELGSISFPDPVQADNKPTKELDILLTSPPIAEMKHSARSRLREKGFMLPRSPGYSPPWLEVKWEFTHTSHTIRNREQ